MIGFSFFNRPVAKLFLGDVGSLPIGLVLAWLLILLAGNGGRVAAIVLPLYSVADSTLTLLRRLLSGERVWRRIGRISTSAQRTEGSPLST